MREGNRTDGGCLSSCLLTPDLTSQLTSLGSQSHLSNLNECLSRCKICHTQENILDFERNVCHSQTTSRDPKSNLTWQHLNHLTRLRKSRFDACGEKSDSISTIPASQIQKWLVFYVLTIVKYHILKLISTLNVRLWRTKPRPAWPLSPGGKYSRIETLLC